MKKRMPYAFGICLMQAGMGLLGQGLPARGTVVIKAPEDAGKPWALCWVFPELTLSLERNSDPQVVLEDPRVRRKRGSRDMPGAVVEVLAPRYEPGEMFRMLIETRWSYAFARAFSAGQGSSVTMQILGDFMNTPLDQYVAPRAASVWSNSMLPESIKLQRLLANMGDTHWHIMAGARSSAAPGRR